MELIELREKVQARSFSEIPVFVLELERQYFHLFTKYLQHIGEYRNEAINDEQFYTRSVSGISM